MVKDIIKELVIVILILLVIALIPVLETLSVIIHLYMYALQLGGQNYAEFQTHPGDRVCGRYAGAVLCRLFHAGQCHDHRRLYRVDR